MICHSGASHYILPQHSYIALGYIANIVTLFPQHGYIALGYIANMITLTYRIILYITTTWLHSHIMLYSCYIMSYIVHRILQYNTKFK